MTPAETYRMEWLREYRRLWFMAGFASATALMLVALVIAEIQAFDREADLLIRNAGLQAEVGTLKLRVDLLKGNL